ncbi:MAG: CDP-alcohol phosphatidyltransferase family protein [Legionella sp.]
MIVKHIPNILTLARTLLIAPFLFFLKQQQYDWAFYTFLFAGLTDAFDGWLARSFDCKSILGSFIDPLADKLLIASSFFSLALIGKLPWWLMVLVFMRDITILLGIVTWVYLLKNHIDLRPTKLSKFNTLLQLTLVTLSLFELAFFEFSTILIHLLVALTTITTAATYLDYAWTWGKKAYAKIHKAT